MTPLDRHTEEHAAYPLRIAAGLVFSLLVGIGAVRFWPVPTEEEATLVFDTRAQETITIEEILPTRQQRRAPAPPAPVPPVIVPDDVVLPDADLELSQDLTLADAVGDTGDAAAPSPPTGRTNATRPDSGPRPVRFVEPEYAEEARRRRIRAEIVVEVLVDARGRVTDARIVERILVRNPERNERESVAALGYGLEESALATARQWTFRPARQDGRAVEAWTTITFSFGL